MRLSVGFFFQAEDGIRDVAVTGVQTCALPISTYDGLAKDARVGSRILLNDGLLSVEVTGVDAPRVRGRVVDGGTLKAYKGMNLPGVQVSAPTLTEKDREDVQEAGKYGEH